MDSSLKNSWIHLLLHLVFLQIHFPYSVNSQPSDYPTANLSTSWVNSPSAPHSIDFSNNSIARAILLRGTNGPRYACGFFCNGDCQTYLFAIFIVGTYNYSGYIYLGSPRVVWSANRNHPVRTHATLELKSDGDLILKDVDGTLAWSTNTTGKSVAGLNLTESGNLVLFDVNKRPVWQSFEHPTDSLVPGQKLVLGQKLSASVSDTNWSNGGLFSLSVTSKGLFAFVGSNPPQAYFEPEQGWYEKIYNLFSELSYVEYINESLNFYIANPEPITRVGRLNVPLASSAQYMKLEHDGHLRVHEWNQSKQLWIEVADLLTGSIGECGYPMVCGKYGICSNEECNCPASTNRTSYFVQTNGRQPDLGCSETVPLSCESSQYHDFLDLADVSYFTFNSDIENTDMDACKQACLKNCSCKAALFQWSYDSNSSSGNCYLPSEIFSLRHMNDEDKMLYDSYAFLKVQNIPGRKTNRVSIIIAGSSLGAFFTLFLIIGTLVFVFRKNRDADEDDDDYIDQVPGMPARFSYEKLKAATENFSRKLGQGGYGSVFEGVLADGMKIAVKRLDGLGHIKKSFLAEVESIGSIRHVNLARLVGFCAEKTYRLLVYEFMPNGSLDTWIFHKNNEVALGWNQRKKIILDIAKGLSYLHEDCRQKIVHLDIKPQNILLDENFNAKVSDFGLSKLIDRDQSQVMTTMRGTPGYLAPEWLSSVITEKVDVYSYGVVVLEILCGRKNLDRSQPEEHMHLLSLFKKKAEDDQLLDMVDKYSEDMQLHGAEIVETMRVAAWCLQSDFAKRPSMSVVVKVLEGVMDVELDIDYNFFHQTSNIRAEGQNGVHYGAATPLLPSVLSGPRGLQTTIFKHHTSSCGPSLSPALTVWHFALQLRLQEVAPTSH